MLIGALGADLQHAAQIHAAGDGRAAGRDVRRHGFTGHARGVERALAAHDHAVDGNAFAGTHDQNVALGDLLGVDARFLAVAQHDGEVRAQLRQRGNGLAGALDGDLLEQLADLEKDHDRRSLAPVLHRNGADRRQRHQKVFIEDLTAQNAADRVPEDVISGQQPRRQHEPGFEPAAAAVAAEHKADRE